MVINIRQDFLQNIVINHHLRRHVSFVHLQSCVNSTIKFPSLKRVVHVRHPTRCVQETSYIQTHFYVAYLERRTRNEFTGWQSDIIVWISAMSNFRITGTFFLVPGSSNYAEFTSVFTALTICAMIYLLRGRITLTWATHPDPSGLSLSSIRTRTCLQFFPNAFSSFFCV